MVTKDSIETAYSFLYQKQNVYVHSTMEWQREDIINVFEQILDEVVFLQGRKELMLEMEEKRDW